MGREKEKSVFALTGGNEEDVNATEQCVAGSSGTAG